MEEVRPPLDSGSPPMYRHVDRRRRPRFSVAATPPAPAPCRVLLPRARCPYWGRPVLSTASSRTLFWARRPRRAPASEVNKGSKQASILVALVLLCVAAAAGGKYI